MSRRNITDCLNVVYAPCSTRIDSIIAIDTEGNWTREVTERLLNEVPRVVVWLDLNKLSFGTVKVERALA